MPTPDERAAAIAAVNDDVITREQLLSAGLTRHGIQWRLERRILVARHPGVYLTSNAPPGLRTCVRAALLACGSRTFASHLAATAFWIPGFTVPAVIELTAVGHNPGPKAGVLLHRARAVHPGEVRRVSGLAVAAPARVVLELAATQPRQTVEHVIQELVFRRRVTDRELEGALARHPGRPGTRMLRSILELETGAGFTQSHAERQLLSLIARAGLPRPAKNLRIEGHRVDMAWPAHRLVVEVDGGRGHDHRLAYRTDRRRDADLVAAGWRVLRFTASQIKTAPLVALARLVGALAS